MDTMTILQRQQERLSQVKADAPSCLHTFERAYEGRSKQAGIKAFCLECIGYDRTAIRNCTAPACPLYEVRPFQGQKRLRTAELSLKSA